MTEMLMQTSEEELLARVWAGDEMQDEQVPSAPVDAGLRQIRALLARLDAAEFRALVLLFGLDGGAPRSRQEVGRLMGRTPAAVEQLHVRALQKLRTLPLVALDTTAN